MRPAQQGGERGKNIKTLQYLVVKRLWKAFIILRAHSQMFCDTQPPLPCSFHGISYESSPSVFTLHCGIATKIRINSFKNPKKPTTAIYQCLSIHSTLLLKSKIKKIIISDGDPSFEYRWRCGTFPQLFYIMYLSMTIQFYRSFHVQVSYLTSPRHRL